MFRTRRDALRLLTAAPFLAPVFREVLGAPGEPIKRAVMIMLHTGVASEYWFPVGAAKAAMDFTGTSLEPLTPIKHKVSIIQDLTVTMGRGDNHQTAPNACLAAQQAEGNEVQKKGVSLDQHIVNKMNFTTARRNLTMALCNSPGTQPVFFKAKGSPATLIRSPYVAINDLFGSFVPGAPSPTTPVNDLALRRSMLDALSGDLTRMSKRLAGPERGKLEAHLSLVRASELRIGQNLMRPENTGGACSKLTSPTAQLPFNNINNLIPLGQVYMDLIAMALACDICRIFGLEVTQSNPNMSFTWPGIAVDSKPVPDGAQGLHRLAHASAGTNDRVLFGKVNATYASLFAYLLKALDAVKEGSRTLLDNSVVMLGNAYGDDPKRHEGKDHSWRNTPYVIGGLGGGFYKSGGQIIDAGGKSHTQVLGSVLEYFQIDRSPSPSAAGDGEFGDGRFSFETLPGLKA